MSRQRQWEILTRIQTEGEGKSSEGLTFARWLFRLFAALVSTGPAPTPLALYQLSISTSRARDLPRAIELTSASLRLVWPVY